MTQPVFSLQADQNDRVAPSVVQAAAPHSKHSVLDGGQVHMHVHLRSLALHQHAHAYTHMFMHVLGVRRCLSSSVSCSHRLVQGLMGCRSEFHRNEKKERVPS